MIHKATSLAYFSVAFLPKFKHPPQVANLHHIN